MAAYLGAVYVFSEIEKIPWISELDLLELELYVACMECVNGGAKSRSPAFHTVNSPGSAYC